MKAREIKKALKESAACLEVPDILTALKCMDLKVQTELDVAGARIKKKKKKSKGKIRERG